MEKETRKPTLKNVVFHLEYKRQKRHLSPDAFFVGKLFQLIINIGEVYVKRYQKICFEFIAIWRISL